MLDAKNMLAAKTQELSPLENKKRAVKQQNIISF